MALISVQEGGGGDYTTLESAVEAGSTVDGDVIEISGTWTAREDTRIAVADALTIRAIGAAKQIGRPWQTGDTHYQHRSTSNSSGQHSFTITNSGTLLLEDLDIQHAGSGVSNEIFRNNAYNTFIARRCILGFASRTDQQDIYYNEYLALVTFECCHFYNAYRSVVDLYGPDNNSIVNINSCTGYNIGFGSAYNSRNGLVGVYGPAAVTVNVFNTLCHTNALSGSLITASDLTTAINLDHVVTNDNSLSNVALNTDIDNVTNATITDSVAASAYIVTNLNTGSFDFRLIDHANNLAKDNHSTATGTGTGLSIPSTDILGTSRPQNSNYDLGAFEIVVGGGSSPLVVQSISQSQTLSQPILTTSSISLLVQGLAQTNSISAPSLTQHNSLLVGGVNQTQSLEAPALTQAHILLTNKIDQAQASGNISLIQAHTLAVDDSSQGQTVGAPNLLQHNILSVDSATQGTTISGALLAVAGSLAVSGVGQNNTVESPNLIQHGQLIADALSQGQSIDATSLAQVSSVIVQALEQAQSTSQTTLNQHNILSVQDLLQSSGISESVLSVIGQLAPNGLTQAQLVEAAILAQHHALNVQSVSQTIDLSNSLLDISAALSVLGVNQAQGLENLNLTSTGVLSVDSLTQQQLADLVRFGGAVIGYLRGEIVISCLVNGKVETFNLVNGNFETIH